MWRLTGERMTTADDYYVGAYWGPRRETASQCARRAALFFNSLDPCDPSFSQWYYGGPRVPRGAVGHPVSRDERSLEELLSKSRTRKNRGKTVIEDLGFSQIMWNAKREASEIHVSCGGYYSWATVNNCLFKPPRSGPVRERLLTLSVLTGIITRMAAAWEPDFAMVSSSELVEVLQKREAEVRVGWLTYLSKRLGRLPPLPAPVRIEPVGELGWLLILSEEPLSAGNPEHVVLAARIRELLDRAGLIALPNPYPSGV